MQLPRRPIRPRMNDPRGFEIGRFIANALDHVDDDDRAEIFETLQMMYCFFCGCKHPPGMMCGCWDEGKPTMSSVEGE